MRVMHQQRLADDRHIHKNPSFEALGANLPRSTTGEAASKAVQGGTKPGLY
jgi:hypothetical protein